MTERKPTAANPEKCDDLEGLERLVSCSTTALLNRESTPTEANAISRAANRRLKEFKERPGRAVCRRR